MSCGLKSVSAEILEAGLETVFYPFIFCTLSCPQGDLSFGPSITKRPGWSKIVHWLEFSCWHDFSALKEASIKIFTISEPKFKRFLPLFGLNLNSQVWNCFFMWDRNAPSIVFSNDWQWAVQIESFHRKFIYSLQFHSFLSFPCHTLVFKMERLVEPHCHHVNMV